MANDQEKHILVDRGIPMLPDLGSSDRAGAGSAGSGSGSDWSVNLGPNGGRGAGPGGSGLGPGRGRRRGITNKQAKRLLRQEQAARAKAQAEAQAFALHQVAEQAAAQARAEAEAVARAQTRAHAEASEHARVEAAVRAEAEKQQTHRSAIELLTSHYPATRSEIARRYSDALMSLPESLQREIDSGLGPPPDPPSGVELQKRILHEKARINLLIASRQAALESTKRSMLALPNQHLPSLTPAHYRAYLEQQSNGEPSRVHAAHQGWVDALKATHDIEHTTETIATLESKNAALSIRHAELSFADESTAGSIESLEARDHLDLTALWSAVAPASSASSVSRSQNVAANLAKRYFVRAAARRMSRNAGAVLALFPRQISDAEMPSPVVATPLSQLGLPPHLDLEYVASVSGTIDVPHRLVSEGSGTTRSERWLTADGVKVGTKVRVRTFTYNSQNHTYEFIRDGESIPALVWTPLAPSSDSSTVSPAWRPGLPSDPGVSTAPIIPAVEAFPALDPADPDDYILISPLGSGLPNTYLLFKDPRSVPGFASGYGKPLNGTWLGPKTRTEGAPIPSSVADTLRGRRFTSFDRLREAVWKAVANDSELSEQFHSSNLDAMRDAQAPFTRLSDQVGGRRKFEIHHKNEIANGGSVYDLDNLVIMTPKRHIEHHRSKDNDL